MGDMADMLEWLHGGQEYEEVAKFTKMKVCVLSKSDRSAQVIFHEDLPEEVEEFVPLSMLEDADAVNDDNLDEDGNTTISVQKWWLKHNDIPYDLDPRDPDESNKSSTRRK